jgi:hypothetical protein
MPDDFLPLNKTLKATVDDPTPWDDRYQHIAALDKRPREYNADGTLKRAVIPGMTIEKFTTRVQSLREGLTKWAAAKIEEMFVSNLNKEYPDLKLNGRPIESSTQFINFYKKGPNDNFMRGVVAFCGDGMWGSDNQFAIDLESEFRRLLRVRFTGIKSNGKKHTKEHKGKCFSQLIVRRKGALVGNIRKAGKKKWKEAIYSKKEDPPNVPTGGDTMKASESGVPKLICQVEVSEASHGFNGYFGVCYGHPDADTYLAKKTPKKARPLSSVVGCHGSVASDLTSSQDSRPKNEFVSWIEANCGNFQTVDEALAAMLEFKGISSPGISSPMSLMPTREEEGTIVTNDMTVEENNEEEQETIVSCWFCFS